MGMKAAAGPCVKVTGPDASSEPSAPAAARLRSGITLAGTLALLLLVAGGLNWGLLGLTGLNVVEWLFGRGTVLTRAAYVAIGAAAVYCAIRLPRWSRAG